MPSTAEKPYRRIIPVDFWRGICLLMIFINHIPDNPLSVLTLHDWGYADAAEVFVFLAGFSAAVAYGRFFTQGTMAYGFIRVIKRTWQLFCTNVLLIFALSAVIAAASAFTDNRPIMEEFNFLPFFVTPDIAVMKIIRLQYMPNMTDILPIYIIFTALLPFIWLLMVRSTVTALVLSFAVWLWANATGHSLASYPEGMKWFFNPLAWQFLFVSGIAVALHREKLAPLLRSRAMLCASLLTLALCLMLAAPWKNYAFLSHYTVSRPAFLTLTVEDKRNLSIVRLMDFWAVLYLAARWLPPDSAFWNRRVIAPITACGRHALAIYCIGVVLSLAAYIYVHIRNSGALETLMIDASGIIALCLLALALEKARSILSQARAPHHGHKTRVST